MNNRQRSSNDEPNRNPNPTNEKQRAEHTARVLELQPIQAQSKDDQATAELGSLLRDAAQANLPDSSVDLRKQLMAELDGGSAATESGLVNAKEVASSEASSRSPGRRFWIAAAASGLLLVGGTIAYNSGFVGTLSNVALLEETEQTDFKAANDQVVPSPKPQTPGVFFRMETLTRQVPVTRMTTETKTRTVPVQRTRVETKQVKQADGSLKFVKVNVPYTEQVAQNYTVQVPIQETVTQSYQVQVPYTADGKPIERSDYGKYGLKCGDRGGVVQGLKEEELVTRFEAPELELDSLDEDFEEELESAAIESTIQSELSEVGALTEGQRFAIHERYSRGPELRSSSLDPGGARVDGIQTDTENSVLSLPQKLKSKKVFVQQDLTGGFSLTGDPRDVANVKREIERLSAQANESENANGLLHALPAEYEYLSGGEVPSQVSGTEVAQTTPKVVMLNGQNESAPLASFYRKKLTGSPPMPAKEPRLDLGGYLDKESRSQGFPGRVGLGDAQQIARERRMVEELELQRDKLTTVEALGAGHVKLKALNLAIKERKAKIQEQVEQLWLNEAAGKVAACKISPEDLSRLDKESRFKGFQGEQDYFELLNSDGEQYEPIFENAFITAKGPAAISTFSIDVDTASYANMRRMLNSGRRPPPNSIRLEELVNYFQYDYPEPTGDHPFSVNMELADCPWEAGQQLLRVGLKGKDIHVAERPATNVVFLIDVSGSMSSNDKLPLLKSGFQMMSRQLGENDRVSIVTYAGNAGVALEPTNGTQTSTINTAIERLSSGGSTHGSAGIKLAYELAQKNFIQGGVNRVMLATDGDLNVGVTSDDALVTLIKEKAAEGVFLTVLGFGTGNLKDGKLEKLADNGNGMYAYIDSTREAHRVLVDQLSGSLVTIAKDVKIQVEFNPAEVKSYRLLGYENRMLETKDFDDDAKDAGEIGAGHTVTAIYQIEPAKAVASAVSLPAGMRYQVKSEANQTAVEGDDVDKDGLSKAALSGELATVALRYKQPDENESERLEVSIKNEAKRFEEASADFRFAAGVAGFGMYLRNSEHKGAINSGLLQRIASESVGKDESGYRSEFIDLIRRASNR